MDLKVGLRLYVICNLLSRNFTIYETLSAWLQTIYIMSNMCITVHGDFSFRFYGFLLLTKSVSYEIKTYTLSEDLYCI